jgi:hypothetical protein
VRRHPERSRFSSGERDLPFLRPRAKAKRNCYPNVADSDAIDPNVVDLEVLPLTYVGTAAPGCPPEPALSLSKGAARRFSRTATLMRKKSMLVLFSTLFLLSCSPRDFLTRRLAADLISTSDAFKAPQQFVLQTGVVSNKEYVSPEYLVLQRRGWISASTAPCSATIAPPPCWDVLLTPVGVETVRSLISADATTKPSLSIPVARRMLIGITGINKQGSVADVDFTWRWISLNEVGAALYSGDQLYSSTVEFRDYDDGWRIITAHSVPRPGQTLDDALKNADPAP